MATRKPRAVGRERRRPRRAWEPPTVTLIGTVAELVHGGTKTGPAEDPDGASSKFNASASPLRTPVPRR